MSNKKIYILGVIVVVVIGAVVLSSKTRTGVSLGSVNVANEYQSLFMHPATSGTSGTLCSNSGALGSIVVTGANTAVLNFYSATTSNSGIRTVTATSSLTRLASLPAATAAGTYTYDVRAPLGIIWESSATTLVPTTTITYRCY